MVGEEGINIKLPNNLHLSFSPSTAALTRSDELLGCQTSDPDGQFPQPHGHCRPGEASVGPTLPSPCAWAGGGCTGQGQRVRCSPGHSEVREKFHHWLWRAGFHSWNCTSGTGETAWVVFFKTLCSVVEELSPIPGRDHSWSTLRQGEVSSQAWRWVWTLRT